MKHTACLLIVIVLLSSAAFSAFPDWKNVKDFGAAGNGTADDTKAIRDAIIAAGVGGTVYFPFGEYRLTGVLKLKQVALTGAIDGGWPGDAPYLPKIIVAHKDAPAVEAGDASSIRGLYFECQNDPAKPEPRPAVILLTGIGVNISNVKIQLPWIGIASDGISNNGRCCIENVFIISALNCGVYLTHTWDTPILNKIEVWNTADYCLNNAAGFRFGHNDQIRASLLFAFRCKTGFLFDLPAEDKHNNYGDFVGCSTDACINGISITKGDVRFSGCTFLNHWATAILKSPKASLQLSGCRLQTNGEPHIIVENCDQLTVSGCQFHRAFINESPAVDIRGGKNISISGCTFSGETGGVRISGQTDCFAISGNVFSATDFVKVDDQTPENRRKAICGNTE